MMMISTLARFWGATDNDDNENEDRICMKCLKTKFVKEFEVRYHSANGHPEYRNDCKSCRSEEHKHRAQLEKIYGHLRPKEGSDYCCPICERNETEITMNGIRFSQTRVRKFTTVWTLDHDHETGEFRGFICNDCNIGIGRFFENPVALRNAADYVITKPSHNNYLNEKRVQ